MAKPIFEGLPEPLRQRLLVNIQQYREQQKARLLQCSESDLNMIKSNAQS